jgi:hypothetical protein
MNTISIVPYLTLVVVGAERVGIIMYISLFRELSASTCHCGRKEERHQNPAGLCRRQNLHHDPITTNSSELLITKSLTNGNKTKRPAPLASSDFKVSAMEKPFMAPHSMPCNNISVYKALGDRGSDLEVVTCTGRTPLFLKEEVLEWAEPKCVAVPQNLVWIPRRACCHDKTIAIRKLAAMQQQPV